MKKILIPGLISLFFSIGLWAHEGHNHEAAVEPAPHGGILRDASPFKTEAVLNGDMVKIYVYDKNLKPLKVEKKTLEGKVQFPREKEKGVTFTRKGEFFEAKIPGINKVHRYDLHINIEAEGKKAVADFGVDNIH